jgi:hypothetical protein
MAKGLCKILWNLLGGSDIIENRRKMPWIKKKNNFIKGIDKGKKNAT